MGANGNNWYQRVAACSHVHSVSVISEGVEREICEDCGNVTVRYESMIDGAIDRGAFARDADSLLVTIPGKRWPAIDARSGVESRRRVG